LENGDGQEIRSYSVGLKQAEVGSRQISSHLAKYAEAKQL